MYVTEAVQQLRDTRLLHRSQSLCSWIVWETEVCGLCQCLPEEIKKRVCKSPVVLTGGLRTLNTGVINYLGLAPALPEAVTL